MSLSSSVIISVRESDRLLIDRAKSRAQMLGLSFSRYVISLIRKDFEENKAPVIDEKATDNLISKQD